MLKHAFPAPGPRRVEYFRFTQNASYLFDNQLFIGFQPGTKEQFLDSKSRRTDFEFNKPILKKEVPILKDFEKNSTDFERFKTDFEFFRQLAIHRAFPKVRALSNLFLPKKRSLSISYEDAIKYFYPNAWKHGTVKLHLRPLIKAGHCLEHCK